MYFLPTVNKARKPKFEAHLRIYDLNNVPLVSGVSQIKWHLPHSIHGEHRGRTHKCPIANHRVEYGYGKIIPVRISIDRQNNLVECPIEFEVLQEFPIGDEKIVLGKVAINLTEYVEESESYLRDARPGTSGTTGTGSAILDNSDQQHRSRLSFGHSRNRSFGGISSHGGDGNAPSSPASKHSGGSSSGTGQQDEDGTLPAQEVREGVIRRHLMQESKINSTLKIGILMVQVDGDRNYIAPPLKTAPVFGGIAGVVTGDQADQEDSIPGQLPSISKSRDAAELQDMYRRSLAASWASTPGELMADACIEDIFGGGSGFGDPMDQQEHGLSFFPGGRPKTSSNSSDSIGPTGTHNPQAQQQLMYHHDRSAAFASASPKPQTFGHEDSTGSPSTEDENTGNSTPHGGGATLRPRDVRSFFHRSSPGNSPADQQQLQPHKLHRRQRSGASDRSARTLVFGSDLRPRSRSREPGGARNDRDDDNDAGSGSGRSPGDASSGSGGGGRHGPGLRGHGQGSTHHHHHHGPSSARRESLGSLATTMGSSDRGRDGFRRAREVDEFEVRDDLIAWRLPGKVS